MNIFRRLTSTVTATVDQAVSQIENHDAVISAALKDARTSAAQARVQLRRVKKDGADLAQRCDILREDIARWAKRAKQSAREDEALALQCVARMQSAERELTRVEDAKKQHDAQRVNLEQAAQGIQKRIQDIEQQRHLLRTRQSSAQAQQLAARLDAPDHEGVDEVLARWESTILAKEDLPWRMDGADELDETFSQEEDEASLRQSLQNLLDDPEQ